VRLVHFMPFQAGATSLTVGMVPRGVKDKP
jgi:hypothetical protein